MSKPTIIFLTADDYECMKLHDSPVFSHISSLVSSQTLSFSSMHEFADLLHRINNDYHCKTLITIGKVDFSSILANSNDFFVSCAHTITSHLSYCRLNDCFHFFALQPECHALAELDTLLTSYFASIHDEALRPIQQALKQRLLEKKRTISTAESCTGGLVAKSLTDLSGASGYFTGGICTYTAQAKTAILKVPSETIAEYGVVSKETVIAMARGAQALFGTDIAVATTGVAGPGPDTDENPEGLVWLAIATGETVIPLRYEAITRSVMIDRDFIRHDCTLFVLSNLLKTLNN